MRIAYFGHSYHEKTRSNKFLTDLLKQLGTVDFWFVEPQDAARSEWISKFNEESYDLIVIYQVADLMEFLSSRHPNVVFVPMYDAMLASYSSNEIVWSPTLDSAKVLCFSWALRREMMRRDIVHACFQYYPNPENYRQVDEFGRLRGLFWYRRREISPETIFDLCRGTAFDKFVIHYGPDPGHEIDENWSPPDNIASLQHSAWSESGTAFSAALQQCNIFFAPRPVEGIGMSVLEAMASGLCVVARNSPAMDEYISNGYNGLLYERNRHAPLDFSAAAQIGPRARESVRRGYERWSTSIPSLLEFLMTPKHRLASRQFSYGVRNQFVPSPARDAVKPLVSVVTVCLNAARELEGTIKSVIGQLGIEFEYVVQDGGSSDGTMNIIRKYADVLASWRSEKDCGPYDAMNAAVDRCRGEWIIFMNAGDSFATDDALLRMFSRVPDDADIVYGHHLYRRAGAEDLHRAADFETTWLRLQKGDLSFDWLKGIPGHQATAARRDLLSRLRFDLTYHIAADHEFYFRARKQGARFSHCDEVIAIYASGGLSAQRYDQCRTELARIARTYGDVRGADQFYARLEDVTSLSNEVERLRSVNSRLGQSGSLKSDEWHAKGGVCEPEGPHPEFGIFGKINWLEAPTAEIVVNVSDEGCRRIVIEYQNSLFDEQLVRIEVNGAVVASRQLKRTREYQSGVLSCMAFLWVGINTIALHFREHHSSGDDRRKLALMMKSLLIIDVRTANAE